MTRKKKVTTDLNGIKNFVYALQKAPAKVNDKLQTVMQQWAGDTKSRYDSLTGYGSGFKSLVRYDDDPDVGPLRSYMTVEKAHK